MKKEIMRLTFYSIIVLLVIVNDAVAFQKQEWKLKSPGKKIEIAVSNKENKLTWSVKYEKNQVIETSPLGIIRSDQQFAKNLKLISSKETVIDEEYSLLVGKKLQCHSKANELTLTFENESKEPMQLIFRAYDDGTAFRYNFPKTDNEPRKIIKEESGFAINRQAKAWIQPYDMNTRKKPCYEAFYENGVAVGKRSPNPAGWAFPLLFNVNSTWLLITEAGLDETYPATHIEDTNGTNVYNIRFPEKEEVTSSADPEPVSSLPWKTPWRLVVIGPSLSTIQETTLVSALNPPSIIEDTSWIKPGRSSWSWWSDGSTPKDFEAQKRYVDFTADMKWEYVLIDAGWPLMKNGSMEDLIKYADGKNVGVVLWYHSGMGREKDTLSYANVMAFPDERKKEFQKIQSWGAKGVKVDFFDSDKQPVIQRYMDILRDAAQSKIMVNFHGSTLPRGWERTYPHLVSMESVKGAEGAGRQEFCDMAPSHNTILPFTRNVVGPMDYTPVTFTNKREAIRRTTFGHELALAVVFESGVFHFADNMKSYQALPDGPKNFLRQVPTAWDETRFVTGIPGKYVVVARRKGNAWYVAGINGQEAAQEISFDLPFVDENNFTFITDGQDTGTFTTTTMKVNKKNNKLTLIPNGGFVLYDPDDDRE